MLFLSLLNTSLLTTLVHVFFVPWPIDFEYLISGVRLLVLLMAALEVEKPSPCWEMRKYRESTSWQPVKYSQNCIMKLMAKDWDYGSVSMKFIVDSCLTC